MGGVFFRAPGFFIGAAARGRRSMNHIRKSLVVPYSARQMFDLVDGVERYPEFLPWCAKTEVLLREGDRLEALLYMDWFKVKQRFGTRNVNVPGRRIDMDLLEGPFKSLKGSWEFADCGSVGCAVDFRLDYEFRGALLTRLINPVFSGIYSNLLDSFIKEARARYAYDGRAKGGGR